MNNNDFNPDDLVLEERTFSSDSRMFAASASSLNLNTLMNYIASPLDLQLRFLCQAVLRYSKQNQGDEMKLRTVRTYFVSEMSRILIAAKTKLKEDKKPLNVTLRLSRYGQDIVKSGNLLNLQFKKADKYQQKSGYIPKQVQVDINDLFNKIVKSMEEKYITNMEEIEEEEVAPNGEVHKPVHTKTQSDSNNVKTIKISLDLNSIDLPDHFKKLDSIMDQNKVGIYEIMDKTTNLGYYEIRFVDGIDDRMVSKIKDEISKIK